MFNHKFQITVRFTDKGYVQESVGLCPAADGKLIVILIIPAECKDAIGQGVPGCIRQESGKPAIVVVFLEI